MSSVQVHDPAELRRVFGAFPTGVTAIAAFAGGVPLGIAASSFTSVSLDPPIVSVCIGHRSTTWPRLRQAPRLGISILGAHQEDACRRLAARDPDRFATLPWRATAGGAVFVEGSSAWLECSVDHQVGVGDHDVILLRVHELDADSAVAPLVFHGSRFRQLQP
jgi:flavin reductase (DIM6/NTAB) family NADH-FMN oxidoreductase RutF